jgi:hypothetical protein
MGMTASTAAEFTLAELAETLRRVEPAVLLVPPRILRRVIKKDRAIEGPGLQVPHRKSYVVDRDALLRIVAREELGLAPDAEPSRMLILLPQPDEARLADRGRAAILLASWRLLFHARVHIALSERRAQGMLDDAKVRERIAQIGATAFHEVRAVLRQERFLLPPGDLATVYEEFAALYLELRQFDPNRLNRFFPDLAQRTVIERMLVEDVDADTLCAATRPEGALGPTIAIAAEDDFARDVDQAAPGAALPRAVDADALLTQAKAAGSRGNQVRAAILRECAGQSPAAREDLEQLLSRLCHALSLPAGEIDEWRQALLALLEPATRGRWPIEARLLYDLQSACVDREREIYAVDLVEWIVTWGRRPVQRLLPLQPLVLTVKHLHTAMRRLPRVRIAENLRVRLVMLIVAAVHRSEQELRERFRPLIRQALDRVGLRPASYPERVSRDKLIEELLDRIIERRFVNMSDLRDALARNQLKLPDLSGPREFFLGDKLIRANRKLAAELDGVYRRGEIYLRWLQRLSSAAFGTAVGRFLTQFVALPFGGAYLGLEAVHHIIDLFRPHHHIRPIEAVATVGLLASPEASPLLTAAALPVEQHHGLHLVNPYTVAVVGVFLLAVLHVDWFRHGVTTALVHVWQYIRWLGYELPSALVRLPWMRRLLQSPPFVITYQWVLKPLPWAMVAVLCCNLLGLTTMPALMVGVGAFAAACALINSRVGMFLEETATDTAVRSWDLFHRDVLPGLYRLVMSVFKRLLEDVERMLYAVDELLRFRAGDNRFGLVWKPILGLVWFCVTYVIRLGVNLFVEPTVNPIKHFPVVTVTAKLIVPLIKPLTELIMVPLEPLVGTTVALLLAGVIIFFLPGLAGFLVWELKENWRLYRSNRRPLLEPVIVGSHGETVPRLLRPGLHSGTLPKLFARLRRARFAAINKQYEALHHVRERLRHFVERDLLAVLAASKRWHGAAIEVGEIQLGTNRIRFELRCATFGGAPVYLDFDERGGWILAGLLVPEDGWLARLDGPPWAALRDALAGFCKLAGAALLREPIDAVLPPEWPATADARPPDNLRFDQVPLAWQTWVELWERDQEGKDDRPVEGCRAMITEAWRV